MSDKITQAELAEMFGSTMPIEAVRLVFTASPETTIGEIRQRLKELVPPPTTEEEGA